ncbi:hypothetical protein AK812_SmicGene5947 [Symbiodinium microadriaticum]|uniref:Uncharacterized protein n=1 Tax=Symbiodinium microadriaticum TaxID=2951 RepID=A0A1Q9ESG5_SYMMI|nr:hypothetical protein AK812_SmicGene5947 [Symbiodinium microadriaticum]
MCSMRPMQNVAELEAQARELRLQAKAQADWARLLPRLAPCAEPAPWTQVLSALKRLILPGRLVTWKPDTEPEHCGLLGRVLETSGDSAKVAFRDLPEGGWLPCAALQPDYDAELCCRPGTRVWWQEGLEVTRAVVAGPSETHATATTLLTSSGLHRTVDLKDVSMALATGSRTLEVGDVLRLSASQGSMEKLGMVVQSTPTDACIRFRTLAAGKDNIPSCEDAIFPQSELKKELAAGRLSVQSVSRPGAAVRRRGEVGVLFSLHADCSAVVDFMGQLGWEGPVEELTPLDADELAQEPGLQLLDCLSELLSLPEVLRRLSNATRDAAGIHRVALLVVMLVGALSMPFVSSFGLQFAASFQAAAGLAIPAVCALMSGGRRNRNAKSHAFPGR